MLDGVEVQEPGMEDRLKRKLKPRDWNRITRMLLKLTRRMNAIAGRRDIEGGHVPAHIKVATNAK